MDSPTLSDTVGHAPDHFHSDWTLPSRSLDLPPGHFSLLPVIDKCDNFQLPQGPWDRNACKRAWRDHKASTITAAVSASAKPAAAASKEPHAQASSSVSDSAVADDDSDDGAVLEEEDDEDSEAAAQARLDGEFLTPFFLRLPPREHPTQTPKSTSRRGSESAGPFKLTPLASNLPGGTNSTEDGGPDSTPGVSSSSVSYAPSASSSGTPTVNKRFARRAPPPVGFLRPEIVRALVRDNERMVHMNCRPVWALDPPVPIKPKPMSRRPSSRHSFSSRRSSTHGGNRPEITPMTPSEATQLSQQQQQQQQPINAQASLAGDHLKDDLEKGEGPYAVAFGDWVNDEPGARREHMDRVVRLWKEAGLFNDVLGGWRNEQYSVFGPPGHTAQGRPQDSGADEDQDDGGGAGPLPGSNVAFTLERAACALFGFATFGVHMTAYTDEPEPRVWVPRRSATKQTWPGYLDNTVAGGITAGDSPFESIVRECVEEASLDPAYVAPRLRPTSVVSYTYRAKSGWIQPEIQYIYDLELPAPKAGKDGEGVTPKPNDSEVESFKLMSVRDILSSMVVSTEWKPNCALVMCDWLVRHGFCTFESDNRFLDVALRLRRPLILPGPA